MHKNATPNTDALGSRGQLRRMVRTALCWGLFWFAFAQLVLVVFMEQRCPELCAPEYGYRLACLRKRLASEPDRPLMLVVGSSHTEMGVRPEMLPCWSMPSGETPILFNFGLSGSGPIEELIYLHRLLAEGIRPRWLLIEVLPTGLYYEPTGLDEYLAFDQKFDQLLFRDLRVLGRLCNRPLRLYFRYAADRLVACYSHRFRILNHSVPDWLRSSSRLDHIRPMLDQSGWVDWRISVTPEQSQAYLKYAEQQYAEPLKTLKVGKVPDRLLQEMLALCREEGIQVALFLTPEGSTFRSWYSPSARTALDEYLTRLSAEQTIAVLDARAWLTDEHFFDGHHLLAEGATRFTTRLAREMIRPLLENRLEAVYWKGEPGALGAERTDR